ncbi:MAG: transposase [Alphaproteobacteria bacterium]|nr:transposase [Alphaproteobacteria bacterium]MCB9697708.1 transposase [Alphaproteobacteria bacterium]
MTTDDTLPKTEMEAAAALIALRWPDGWNCPDCGNSKFSHLTTRPRVLACTRCNHRQSVTANTPLERCRLPLVKVFKAARLLTRKQSISARKLAEAIGVCTETAWSLGHRLRAGHVAESLQLGPQVQMGTVIGKRRPPFGKKKDMPFLAITILWDQQERMVALPGRPDSQGARRFIDRHSSAEIPFFPERVPLWLMMPVKDIIDRVHRSVSDRWLPFYAGAAVAWVRAARSGTQAMEAMLGATLARTTHPFRRLRPRPVAEWPNYKDWRYSRTQIAPSQ